MMQSIFNSYRWPPTVKIIPGILECHNLMTVIKHIFFLNQYVNFYIKKYILVKTPYYSWNFQLLLQ